MITKTIFSFLFRPLKIVRQKNIKPIKVDFNNFKTKFEFTVDNKTGIDGILKKNIALKINPRLLDSKIKIKKDCTIVKIDFKETINMQSLQFKEIIESKKEEIKSQAYERYNERYNKRKNQ